MVEGGDRDPGTEDAPSVEPSTPAVPKPPRGNVLAGYAVAGVAVVLATIAVVALIASIGGDSDGGAIEPDSGGEVTVRDGGPKVLPEGGLFKIPDDVDDAAAGAAAAGCELMELRAKSRDHIDPGEHVDYPSNPPTSGRHAQIPAPDGAYKNTPDAENLVHTLEHSRVIVWFKRDLPAKARASLKAYYDNDSQLMLLVPDADDMKYEIAASAWTRKPGKHGTGRLLGCPEYSDDVYTALEAFKKDYRGRGLELVP